MKFSTFLFPDSAIPRGRCRHRRDDARGAARRRTRRRCVWLAEHHFDGISVYGDPMVIAGALASRMRHAALGFAVLQMALHHRSASPSRSRFSTTC